MTDRQILFSAPMVRALLAGTKTQTRRVLKPQPFEGGYHEEGVFLDGVTDEYARFSATAVGGGAVVESIAPVRYAPGDRLWVREAWRTEGRFDHLPPSGVPEDALVHYEADGLAPEWAPRSTGGRYRHGRFMCRRMSRLTLTVTEVRVQPLQYISEADAVAEGIIWQDPTDDDRAWVKRFAEENGCDDHIDGVWIAPGTRQGFGVTKEDRDRPQWGPTASFAYRCLWNYINGPDAWDADPWVVAVSFDVARQNIDAVAA